MNIKLWGVRGSIPTPMGREEVEQRIRGVLTHSRDLLASNPSLTVDDLMERLPGELWIPVGGETTCCEVKSNDQFLIIDMGSGARRLGYEMAARGVTGDIHILMTHTHWDHIQGWPFFLPAYNPANTIHFHSAIPDCQERYNLQQKFEFFPIGFQEMPAKKEYHLFQPGEEFRIGPFRIQAESLPHPGGSVAYRIQSNSKKFIFSTDTEFFGPNLQSEVERHNHLFNDTDLLVLDAQYTIEEAAKRVGWGHTSMEVATEAAMRWKVKHLVFTHHEPAHSDARIYEMFRNVQEYYRRMAGSDGSMKLELGLEGSTFQI